MSDPVFPTDTYAVVNNNVVENIIVWDGLAELGLDAELIQVTEGNLIGIGWVRVDGIWQMPAEPNPE